MLLCWGIVWVRFNEKIMIILIMVMLVRVNSLVVLLVNNVLVCMCMIGVRKLLMVLNRLIKLIFVVSVVLDSSCVGIV